MQRIRTALGNHDAPKTIVGHLSLSSITTQDSRMVGWILAPLAVALSHRGKTISSELVDHAIRRAMSSYQPRIQIYVDPAFYERFGFDRQQAMNVKRPFPLSQPMGWRGSLTKKRNSNIPSR